jgi:hypothetical protein
MILCGGAPVFNSEQTGALVSSMLASGRTQRAHHMLRTRILALLHVARRLAAQLVATRRRRIGLLVGVLLPPALLLLPGAWLVHHVYFDRSGVPDIEPFIRFEPPTTGVIRDIRGNALIELAHEYRRVVTYDQVPVILRQAIISTTVRFRGSSRRRRRAP